MKKALLLSLVLLLVFGCEKENVFEGKIKEKSMNKELSTYGGFTQLDIIARSSATCDLTTSGSNLILASDVTVTKVKNVLGVENTNVTGLCSHANVNRWSNFGPYKWDYIGQNFVQSLKYPYNLDDFAGYNHNAIGPSAPTSYTIEEDNTYTATITPYYLFGEIDFISIAGFQLHNELGIRFTLYNQYNEEVAFSRVNFVDLVPAYSHIKNGVETVLSFQSQYDNLTLKIELWSGNSKVANLPNCPNIPVTVIPYSGSQTPTMGVVLGEDFVNDYYDATVDIYNTAISYTTFEFEGDGILLNPGGSPENYFEGRLYVYAINPATNQAVYTGQSIYFYQNDHWSCYGTLPFTINNNYVQFELRYN